MKKVSLLFGIHMHQPVDNFGDAVEEAINLCYKPFFETMVRYPEFKFAVHSSGWLLDEIRTKHQDIFENMQVLTKHGSIEWISAGYYEPVLSSIPSCDRVAQIEMMNKFLKKHFGVQPRGLWLTERVWESALVPDLSTCKIDYVLVDDYHFLSSGYDASSMDGYYTTEESAKELSLFPIAKSLRYALPFYSVQRSIEAILARSKRENSAAIIFDDAEKFGLWPKTHAWVYEKKWLEQFIEAVLSHEQIIPEHYSHYMKKNRSLGIAYLGNTSYIEMGEWSLHAEQTLSLEKLKQDVGEKYFNDMGVAFIKGGIWKNFFVKYHESNYLHKRMLYFSKDQEKLSKTALESLYKLQTNDVFWHGVFGGLYLPNLRDNAYRYLLELEKSRAKKGISFEVLDIDKDGHDELKVLTHNISAIFSSKFGGQMVEFGSFDTLFNWQNTLMRRYEAYHEKIFQAKDAVLVHEQRSDEIATIHHDSVAQDEELKAELIYDWHPKNSFIEHICTDPLTFDNYRKLEFKDVADFANQPFILAKNKTVFSREGAIYLDETYKTMMKKEYAFDTNSVVLKLDCKTAYEGSLYFAQEFNFHFAHPHKVTFNGKTIEEGLSEYDCKELVIIDDFTNKVLKIKMSQKCTIIGYILNTVSQSESGFNKMAQEISFVLTLPFVKNLTWSVELELENV